MSKKLKFLVTAGLSTTILFSGVFTNLVQAEENVYENQENFTLSQEQYEIVTSFLTKYKVNEETQLQLIEKIENGEILDSDSNKQPVNFYTVESDLITENVAVFEDGSIGVTTLDLTEAEVEGSNNNMITPFAISTEDGSVKVGSGYKIYKNAEVYHNTILVSAGFHADFTVVDGVGSYITYLDQGYTLSILTGYASGDSLTLINGKETTDRAAEAILKWTYVNATAGASVSSYLKLHIKNGKVTTPRFW